MPNQVSLRMLEKPTKLLLYGIVLGIVVLVTGFAVSYYYSSLADDLVTECKNENKKPTLAGAPSWGKDPLLCNLHELESTVTGSNHGLVGVQAKMVETHRLVDSWRSRANMLSAVLVGIFALPYGWYFLLHRIKELSNAIFGK